MSTLVKAFLNPLGTLDTSNEHIKSCALGGVRVPSKTFTNVSRGAESHSAFHSLGFSNVRLTGTLLRLGGVTSRPVVDGRRCLARPHPRPAKGCL